MDHESDKGSWFYYVGMNRIFKKGYRFIQGWNGPLFVSFWGSYVFDPGVIKYYLRIQECKWATSQIHTGDFVGANVGRV